MTEIIRKGLSAALDLILPRTCVVCGCRLNLQEDHLCLGCEIDMPMTYYWTMPHNPMADRFNAMIEKYLEDGVEIYAYACALFFYSNDASYRFIPYNLKYHGYVVLGADVGRMLGRKMLKSGLWNDVDMVIPVPLHVLRKWRRGYNQAEIIADAIAEILHVPMRNDILLRKRKTMTQTKLDVEDKVKNVAGAFVVRDDFAASMEKGKPFSHILLVDDVFTTGSTLLACFTALRSVFPPSVRISVATMGFVGGA